MCWLAHIEKHMQTCYNHMANGEAELPKLGNTLGFQDAEDVLRTLVARDASASEDASIRVAVHVHVNVHADLESS